MEIPYRVEHRDVKYPRLEFIDLQLVVILPHHVKDPSVIIEKRKAWIEKKWSQIQEALRNSGDADGFMIFGEKYAIERADVDKPVVDHVQRKIALNPEKREHARQIVNLLKKILRKKTEEIVNEYSVRIGLKPVKIAIRRQKTKWGSCSSSGNISLNLKLVCLPEELIRYVIYHELVHLKHRKHDRAFWRMISQEFPDHEKMEKELLTQWFKTEKLFQNLVI